jgi:hypothetical protein
MASAQTEVAASGGYAGRWGGRLLLIGLVVVTLFGAVLGLQVSRSSDDRGRTGAQAEPVYLHGRNLRGLDPLLPVYLHGRNLRGLDPLPAD